MSNVSETLFQSQLNNLELLNRGKVRDLYAVDEDKLLIVACDRLSAFDVVLPDPIPSKGAILTALSNFWFSRTEHIVPNHLVDVPLTQILTDADERRSVAERATVVRRLHPLPIEAIVRGYLIGSGWKEYQSKGAVCGIRLASGMQKAQQLPEPIYTPSTKAALGEHDQNITFEQSRDLLGDAVAEQVRARSLRLYREAAAHALQRGIIIADTKFEFALDEAGRLVLIDELFTPDSSRFWPVERYRPGTDPPSFDKQFVRDYLETLDWNKEPPAPALPTSVVEQTVAKYREALRIITA
jgi:phosphoribosylaminoimidazole-succinocarboxamide synthase